MANTFKFGNGNWAVKDGYALAYNDENNNFKPLPFDFTRASSATRVNKQGLVETVPSGKPRIDFTDNTDGHLLLEPSRTNLISQSENINSWLNQYSPTLTQNSSISPDGSVNADKITSTQINSAKYISVTTVNSIQYNVNVFVKNIDSQRSRIEIYNAPNCILEFNWTNNQPSTQSTTTFTNVSYTYYGNDWWRISANFTSTGTSNALYVYPDRINGTDSILLWGAQVEAGSYATSYIPTEGSSVTRVNEDILIKGFQDTILNGGDAPFALFIDFENYTLESLGDGLLFYDQTDGTSTEGRAYLYNSSAGFGQNWNDNPVSFTNNSSVKLLWNYTSLTEGYVWKNGTKGSLNSGPNAVDFDYLKIVSQFNLLKINRILIYNTALTDTEAQNLTS